MKILDWLTLSVSPTYSPEPGRGWSACVGGVPLAGPFESAEEAKRGAQIGAAEMCRKALEVLR